MNLLIDAIVILIFNLPFGYWRANVRKFSLQWILAIHLPVPVVIAIRFLSGIGFQLYTYPILVGTFFLGQYLGKKIYDWNNRKPEIEQTSCMVMDFYRFAKSK